MYKNIGNKLLRGLIALTLAPMGFLVLFVYVFYFNLRAIPIAPSVRSAGSYDSDRNSVKHLVEQQEVKEAIFLLITLCKHRF